MVIKIQCACGSRYSFEVEPVNGHMPTAINCPDCMASGVAQGNAEIARQLAANPAPPAAPRMRVGAVPAPPAPEPARPPQPVPLADCCSKHPQEPPMSACFVCGKPICRKCMKQFGFLCSGLCRQKADLEGIVVPVCDQQQRVQESRARSSGKRIFLSVTALVFACLGTWVWYAYFARNPKPVYSVVIPKIDTVRGVATKPYDYYRLIAPNQLVYLKDKKLTLFDVVKKTELWSVELPQPGKMPVKKPKLKGMAALAELLKANSSGSAEFEFEDPNLMATTKDLWLWFPDRVFRFDRQAGTLTAPLTNQIAHVTRGQDVLLVASKDPNGRKFLTRLSFLDGSMQSEEISPAPVKIEETNLPPATVAKAPGRMNSKTAKAKTAPVVVPVAAQKAEEPDAEDSDWAFYDQARQFIPAGESVVQFNSELLEEKVVQHVTVNQEKPKKSLIDSSNVRADQGVAAASQYFAPANEEVDYEDLSRRRVTVNRRFCSEVPGWTNDVVGYPSFYPLKTLDIVVAGTKIYALDKSNKKIWEASSSFRMANMYSSHDFEHSPCVQLKDGLYIADLGSLTRYDLATGQVLWRVDTVGASHIQEDWHGDLYVTTTTANVNMLQVAGKGPARKIYPIILKIAPKTGKVLWKSEHFADDCLLSGKFVYSVRRDQVTEFLNLEDGPKTTFTMGLLNPNTGKMIWSYYQYNRNPVNIEVQDNWILAYFEEKLLVMKFFSL